MDASIIIEIVKAYHDAVGVSVGRRRSPVFRNFSHNIYGFFVVICISGKWRTAGNDTGYSTLENICIARSFRGNVSYPKPVQ